jgi:sugar phosphate isomerase/epimerase
LALCRELSIGTLVVAADLAGPLGPNDVDRAGASLREAARCAAAAGVRLALEFQAKAAFCSNLQTAAELVARCESPWVGLCLDAFHFYVGPSKASDLSLLAADNLFHVQLCDLAGVPRELACDGDRVLPGDGDFDLDLVVQACRRIGYTGHVSVELMNPQVWQVPPRQFGEIAASALRRVLRGR